MNVLLAVLLCLSAVVTADEYFPGGASHHGTTVCIEIRPSPHSNPTKVCGPVVHGGPQQVSRPQQKAADPMVFNLPAAAAQHHSSESDESREAEAPCGTNNGQKSIMPFGMRQAQPGPGPQPQPQPGPQPQHMMQRMDMPPEGMMPMMMGMEMEGASGWRQASPPCAHNQRASMPMGYPGPMMRPPMPMPNSRTWMVNPQQAMMMKAAEEQPMGLGMGMAMRAAEEKPPGAQPKKESLENLLKECEEKTKLLQEKEAKITELKNHMANSKKEEELMKKE